MELLLGVLFGILTSWLFWRYLLLLKPKISISPFVLRGTAVDEPSQMLYRIKIMNLGNRQVKDIAVNATVIRLNKEQPLAIRARIDDVTFRLGVPLGLGVKTKHLDLEELSPVSIFTTRDNVDVLLDDTNHRLVLTLAASDALSSTTLIQRVVYGKQDVRDGIFDLSLSFKILNSIPHR